MAYKSNDIQEVVTAIDVGRNNELRVSTIKDKDSKELKSIDIRTWWLSDEGEMRPSGKGVRIKSENLADVISSLLQNCGYETINDIECNTGIEIALPDKETENED